EHLADLGRGDEVAGCAEGIPAGVVASVRLAHELRQADRPGGDDQPPEAVRQRSPGHAPAGLYPLASSGRRRAQTTRPSPPRTSGMLSHCPCDSPVSSTRCASSASGSRKNSTTNRAPAISTVNTPTRSPV